MGLAPIKDTLQIDSIDDELRNSLWNAFYRCIWRVLPTSSQFMGQTYLVEWGRSFLEELMMEYFHDTVDDLNYNYTFYIEKIKNYFIKVADWNKTYDFIEFLCNASSFPHYPETQKEYIKECNRVLEKHLSGYRIIDYVVTSITNESELTSIAEAAKSPYEYANQHLHSALEKLSDRGNPDYRNSIKESISAVEAICRKLTGESTLDRALKKIENNLDINHQFKQGLEKLYHYTNGESGIRHALIDEGQPSFDEAKFMLVACSAFVNYLTAKASVLND